MGDKGLMVRTLRPAVILALALLGACQGARPAERAVGGQPVSGPVRLVYHQGAGALGAVAEGVLRLDEQGCLRLIDRALAWPAQAGLDLSQPGVVRVFRRDEDVSVRVGEKVAVLAASTDAPAPSACAGPQWAVTRFAPAG